MDYPYRQFARQHRPFPLQIPQKGGPIDDCSSDNLSRCRLGNNLRGTHLLFFQDRQRREMGGLTPPGGYIKEEKAARRPRAAFLCGTFN